MLLGRPFPAVIRTLPRPFFTLRRSVATNSLSTGQNEVASTVSENDQSRLVPESADSIPSLGKDLKDKSFQKDSEQHTKSKDTSETKPKRTTKEKDTVKSNVKESTAKLTSKDTELQSSLLVTESVKGRKSAPTDTKSDSDKKRNNENPESGVKESNAKPILKITKVPRAATESVEGFVEPKNDQQKKKPGNRAVEPKLPSTEKKPKKKYEKDWAQIKKMHRQREKALAAERLGQPSRPLENEERIETTSMAGVESTANLGGAKIRDQSLWKLLQFDNKSEPLHAKVKKAHEVDRESLFLEFKEQIRYVLANTHSHQNEFHARNYIESETAVRKLLRDVHEMFEKPDTGGAEVASAEIPTGKSEELPTTLSADDFLEMGDIVKRIIHIRKITNVDDLFSAMERVNKKSVNQLTEFFRGTIDTAPKSKNGALDALEMINFLRYEGDTKIRLAETVMKTIENSEERHDGLDWLARIYAHTGKIEKLEEMEKQGVINDGKSFLFLAEACVVSEDPHELFPCWDRLRSNQKVKIGRTEYLAMTKACKSLRFPNQEYRVLLDHVHTDMVDFTHHMAKDLIDCCQRNKDWAFAKRVYVGLLETGKHAEYPLLKTMLHLSMLNGDAAMAVDLCTRFRSHKSHRNLLSDALDTLVRLERWKEARVVWRSYLALRVTIPPKTHLMVQMLKHYQSTSDWAAINEMLEYMKLKKLVSMEYMMSFVIDASAGSLNWRGYEEECDFLRKKGRSDEILGIAHKKLTKYLETSNWELLKEFWRHLKRGPISNDEKILSIMLDAALHTKDWDIFDEVWSMTKVQRVLVNVVAINTALSRNAHDKEWIKEFKYRLNEKGFYGDTYMYNSLLTAAVNRYDWYAYTDTLSDMINKGIKKDTATYNIRLYGCNLQRDWGLLESIWKDMELCKIPRDQRSYHLMLHGAARSRNLVRLMSVWRQMIYEKLVDVKAKEIMLESLIGLKAWKHIDAVQSVFPAKDSSKEVFSFNIMLAKHQVKHDWLSMKRVWNKMLSSVQPDGVTYISMMAEAKNHRDWTMMDTLWARITSENLVLPHGALRAMLDSCRIRRDWTPLDSLADMMEDQHFYGDFELANLMLEGCVRSSREQLFLKVWHKICAVGHKIDLTIVNTTLRGCLLYNQFELWNRVMAKMRKDCISANAETFDLMMEHALHRGEPEQVEKLYSTMVGRGLMPTSNVVALVRRSFLRRDMSYSEINSALHRISGNK